MPLKLKNSKNHEKTNIQYFVFSEISCFGVLVAEKNLFKPNSENPFNNETFFSKNI
jgi:hypothetical protein